MSPQETRAGRKYGMIALQVLAGLVLTSLCGFLVWRWYPQPALPAGWQTLSKPQNILSLLEVGEQIWVGSVEGLALIDRDRASFVTWAEADVPLAYVNSLASDGQSVWAGHEQGVSQYTAGSWQKLVITGWQPGWQVLHVYYGPRSGLWVGLNSGLAHRTENGWTIYSLADGLASPAVSVIFEDDAGRIWAGDGNSPLGGLSCFNGQSWQAVSSTGVLAHNSVNAIVETAGGDLWFGTGLGSLGGASVYDGDRWHSIYKADGLAGERVRSMLSDQRGKLWFGSEVDGLAIWLQPGWLTITPDEGLAGWEVRAMIQDSQQNIWLGTNRGLTRIQAGAWLALVDGIE